MTAARLASSLIKSAKTSPDPFMTYKDFGRAFGLSDKNPRTWANRKVLDSAAAILKSDPDVGIDLTFLIRNQRKRFPSVIDGKPYKPGDDGQQKRARDVADQIIAKFAIRAKNPY
jgi:hypothetical protein